VFVCSLMTNKKQLITALTLATILIAGGISLTPLAYSTNNNGNNNDKKWNDNKDKQGGIDYDKFKKWKNNHDEEDNDEHDDKVKICHIPPGNPDAAHTIWISKPAVDAHLAHGDTLDACPNDDKDEDEPTTITFLRAITNDNGKEIIDTDFTVVIDGTPIQTGIPIEVTPNIEHIISGTVQVGFSFVLIAGQTECPSTLAADTFKVKEGKSVVCTIYYDDDFVEGGAEQNTPGVIFNFGTSPMTPTDLPDNGSFCSDNPDIRPCIQKISGQKFSIFPDFESDSSDQSLTDTSLIILTVLDTTNPIVGGECAVIGVQIPDQAFVIRCPGLDFVNESDLFNVNYAIIETSVPP
jgi:hypothetical protein